MFESVKHVVNESAKLAVVGMGVADKYRQIHGRLHPRPELSVRSG